MRTTERISKEERRRLKDIAYMKRLSYGDIAEIVEVHPNTVGNFLKHGTGSDPIKEKITQAIENYKEEKAVA